MQNSTDNKNTTNIHKATARLIALQVLYADEFSQDSSVGSHLLEYLSQSQNKIYEDMLRNGETIAAPEKNFLLALYEYTKRNIQAIDLNISQNLKGPWKIDNIDPVILSIIRLAISEMLFFGDIPGKVIIDQYVSLTGDFYSKTEIGFVNALLDSLHKNISRTIHNTQEL
jgi:N utilization substance protein B